MEQIVGGDGQYEVWHLDWDGPFGKAVQEGDVEAAPVYLRVGEVAGLNVMEAFYEAIDIPAYERTARPFKPGDILKTPDGRWCVALPEGLIDISRDILERDDGTVTMLRERTRSH
jgi:hypothetical protein